jgi:Tol biopolymer transport system component
LAGNNQELLKAGIEAARAGDKATALRLFRQVTLSEPRNEVAWMWQASVSDTLDERRRSLEQALRINPNNSRAKDALAQLDRVAGPPAAPAPAARPVGGPARNTAPRPTRKSPVDRGRETINPMYIIGVLLVAAAMVVFVLFASNTGTQQAALPDLNATQTAQVAALLGTAGQGNDSNPVNSTRPTATATRFLGVIVTPRPNTQPTFPPTFTPTATATETVTPLPSATFLPFSTFTLLYTIDDGGIGPAMWSASGSGVGQQVIGTSDPGFRDPVYSPDGEQIAFIRTVTYENAAGTSITAPELFIAPARDVLNARQVTRLEGEEMNSPTWSPDGLQLAVASSARGNLDIWRINADGTEPQRLTDNTGVDTQPAWSPQGDVVVYASDQANGPDSGLTEIFSVTVDGETIIQLTDAANSSYTPSWSPAGTRIVFASDRNGDGDIFVMDAAGQALELLTVDDAGAEDRIPVFMPNARDVAFSSNREDQSETFKVYVMDVNGGAISPLEDTPFNPVSLNFRPQRDAMFR